MEAVIQQGRADVHKRHINVALLVAVLAICLLPSMVVVATGLGGYASEKLIAVEGASDSQLFIGRTGVSNSFLDIILGSPPPPFDPTDPVTPLINLFVPVLVITAIYGLVKTSITGEFSLVEMFLVFIFAYMLVAVLPGVQAAVASLVGQ